MSRSAGSVTKQVPFREIVSFALGGGWGEAESRTDFISVAVIRGTDFGPVGSGGFLAVPRRWESKKKVERRLLQPGDLLLEISGGSSSKGQSTGRSLFIAPEIIDNLGGVVIPASFCRLIRVDESVASSRYVYYALRDMHNSGRAAFYENQSTGISNFQFEVFLDNEYIRLPTLGEQRAVASLLGALDDKITVNERIASTALELGVALYDQKSISAEWRSLRLGDAARWHSGGTPKTSVPEYWNGDIPWISATSLKSPWIRYSDRLVTKLGAQSGTRIAAPNTILFVVRGMSLTSEFRVGIAQCEVAFGQDCKAIVAKPNIDSITLFLAVKSKTQEVLQMVDLAGHGTGRLATDRLAALPVQLPPEGLATTSFSEMVHPLIDRASLAHLECKSLAALRDTLLPQLMSGRLRVKEAEKIVEDYV